MLVVLFQTGKSERERQALIAKQKDYEKFIVIDASPYSDMWYVLSKVIEAANTHKNIVFNTDFGSRTETIATTLRSSGAMILVV